MTEVALDSERCDQKRYSHFDFHCKPQRGEASFLFSFVANISALFCSCVGVFALSEHTVGCSSSPQIRYSALALLHVRAWRRSALWRGNRMAFMCESVSRRAMSFVYVC
ncbi:unnamed protein product, partial [Scytosiphon promiscuus]